MAKPKYRRVLMDAIHFYGHPRGVTVPWFVRYCNVMRSMPLPRAMKLVQHVLNHGVATGFVGKDRNYIFLDDELAAASAPSTTNPPAPGSPTSGQPTPLAGPGSGGENVPAAERGRGGRRRGGGGRKRGRRGSGRRRRRSGSRRRGRPSKRRRT